MGNTKTLRTLSTILGYSARRNVQKCTIPRCNTCILATTRTFVFFSVARQRKENRMSRTCKNQGARTVLSSTPPPMNSRTVCAFLPREFFSCLPGFAHPGHRLHSLVDSFHICLATNSLFSHIYFSNERVFFRIGVDLWLDSRTFYLLLKKRKNWEESVRQKKKVGNIIVVVTTKNRKHFSSTMLGLTMRTASLVGTSVSSTSTNNRGTHWRRVARLLVFSQRTRALNCAICVSVARGDVCLADAKMSREYLRSKNFWARDRSFKGRDWLESEFLHPKVPLNRVFPRRAGCRARKTRIFGLRKNLNILSSSLLFGKAFASLFLRNEWTRNSPLSFYSITSHTILQSRNNQSKNWLRALLLRSKARTKQKSTSVKVKTERLRWDVFANKSWTLATSTKSEDDDILRTNKTFWSENSRRRESWKDRSREPRRRR